MATSIESAKATGAELQTDSIVKRSAHSHANASSNGMSTSTLQPLAPIVRARQLKKYRHVAAVHSKDRTSCLSHDSEIAPSFLGFRNLMVIVLSMSATKTIFPPQPQFSLTSAISCRKPEIDDREFQEG
jgi:diacylglycerol O-acyltransferase 1